MKRILARVFSLSTLLLFMASCNFLEKKDKPIARAFDEYLYPKDIEGIVPDNVHGNDSIAIIRAFIDQWQQSVVLLKKAERNVSLDEKSIQEQLENYKKTLIRFQY